MEALVTCILPVAVHDGPFETENNPAPRHVVNCELIWQAVLLALVTAALEFWVATWISEVCFATC